VNSPSSSFCSGIVMKNGGDLHHLVRDKDFKFVLLQNCEKKEPWLFYVPEFNLSLWRPGSLL
jgi:hypothetical protein